MSKPKLSGPSGPTTSSTTFVGSTSKSGPILLRAGVKADREDPAQPPKEGIVVYGLDSAGKPKAGRFSDRDAAIARQAALALNLNVRAIDRPELRELAAQIPVGRVHAQGKAFIPIIKQALFDELHRATSSVITMAATAKAGPSVSALPAAKPPKDWDSIAVGDLVLYSEGPREGFWESVVLSRDGTALTCKYRDFPRLPSFRCSAYGVALLRADQD